MATKRKDEDVVQVRASIPRELHLAMKLAVIEADETVSEFIEAAVRERLKRVAS